MSDFVDRELNCTDCPVTFIFSAGEQRFFEERDLKDAPKRCHECRHKKKRERAVAKGGTVAEEFPAVCTECGVETTLPFKPMNDKPVFCRNCFRRRDTAQRNEAAQR